MSRDDDAGRGAAGRASVGGRRPGESADEQLDRNFGELLQELRVTQTGTQILFAFLLTIAFTRVFTDADTFTHRVYAVTLVLSALASALLIAPVALHRTVFRQGLKEPLVTLSSRSALAGVYLLMLAMTGSLLLALDTALTRGVAVGVASAVGGLTLVLWVVVPVAMRLRSGSEQPH